MHAYIQTVTHTYIHTYIHTSIHTYIYTYIGIHKLTNSLTNSQTHTYKQHTTSYSSQNAEGLTASNIRHSQSDIQPKIQANSQHRSAIQHTYRRQTQADIHTYRHPVKKWGQGGQAGRHRGRNTVIHTGIDTTCTGRHKNRHNQPHTYTYIATGNKPTENRVAEPQAKMHSDIQAGRNSAINAGSQSKYRQYAITFIQTYIHQI